MALDLLQKCKKHFCGQREKVSQRGLGGFPHERLANPEGVKGERENTKPFPFPFSQVLQEVYCIDYFGICNCCINQLAAAVLVSSVNRSKVCSTRAIGKPVNTWET